MAVATLTIDGKKFVVIPDADYRKLKSGAAKSKLRLSREDKDDIKAARRAMKEGNGKYIPWEEVRRRAGLK